ncbi:hypothetical protein ALP68_101662 [Pseudomonas ficuserectae]|nr:hypothetical protein ALO69_101900 [Pseudomonas ficuserectae]RMS34518.1 hypothetical protein ALP67_101548 [Pseudomonas ficuserectae]RMS39125.1 hypothetical protein ALP68_101662 [Pseudomonas ficuserectae]
MRSIITMIEEGRECVDIAQQLHAVEKAVRQAKRTLIQDHIDHCLEDTCQGRARTTGSLQANHQIPLGLTCSTSSSCCSKGGRTPGCISPVPFCW